MGHRLVYAQSDTSRFAERFFRAEIAAAAAAQVGLSFFWYTDEMQRFHGFNDLNQWGGMDKVGHGFTAYRITRLNSDLLSALGMDPKRARMRSFLLSQAFLIGVEVLDGFSSNYGFSGFDVLANAAGGVLGLVHNSSGWQQGIQLKYNYRRSGLASLRPDLLGSNGSERWLKDYNGQTYWLSVFPGHFTDKKFPKWIGMSMGYGIHGFLGGRSNPIGLPAIQRSREFQLALDVDLVQLFRKTKWGRHLRWISFVKLPLPGIQFRQGSGPRLGFY
ncbi:MAG TPA: DUF2279 domain-containing protein [Luteibaculaceae bacterium]|nr:DUF2279 domain-containing protein [Luteibaculaceae bacterium]